MPIDLNPYSANPFMHAPSRVSQRELARKILEEILIPGRMTRDLPENEKTNPEPLSSRERVLFYTASYALPIAFWASVFNIGYNL